MNNELTPLNDLEKIAAYIAASGLFGIKTKEQAIILMLISQAEGKPAVLAAQDYDIIQGRPSKRAKAMQRDFQLAGGKILKKERSDTRACAVFSHPSCPEPIEVDWDLERAKKAGLLGKDMYGKYTRNMLWARVISEGVGASYPAATSGFYVPEEVREFKDITPHINGPHEDDPGEQVMEHEELVKTLDELKSEPPHKAAVRAFLGEDKPKDKDPILEMLKAAVKKIAKIRNVTDDEATISLFKDESGKMTFDKIDKLSTPKQLEKAKAALVLSSTIMIGGV